MKKGELVPAEVLKEQELLDMVDPPKEEDWSEGAKAIWLNSSRFKVPVYVEICDITNLNGILIKIRNSRGKTIWTPKENLILYRG